jgi:gamma-glutamylputrescine oxidase
VQTYPNSLYAATVDSYLEQPQLTGEVRCDVCVVGGGFTGVSTALHLAQRGYKVVLVEAHKIGWGASGRNGGQLGPGQAITQPEVVSKYGHDQARLLWEIADSGKELVKSLISENEIDCHYIPGNMACAVTQADLDDFKVHVDYVEQRYGYQHQSIYERSEIQAIAGTSCYAGGMLDVSAGHLHPLRYVLGLARAALSAGAMIYENTEVTEIRQGAKAQIITNEGRVIADYVVLGCNGYLGRLAPKIASQILPADNYQIATAPLSDELQQKLITNNACLWDTSRQVYYYRKTHDGRLIFGGGVGHPGCERDDLEAVVRKHLVKVYPELSEIQIDYAWTGTFANTRKKLPSFGRLAPNILYAHGYTGHGIGLGTMAGQIMAECIAGTAERFDLMSSIPTRRFPGAGLFNTQVLSLGFLYIWLADKLRG